MEVDSPNSSTCCAYCASLKKPGAETHDRRNCPVLAAMGPCIHCGARGAFNHTAMHCPDREKTLLRLIRLQKAPWKDLPPPLVAKADSYKDGEMPAPWMWTRTFKRHEMA